jgi:hypothetical protein
LLEGAVTRYLGAGKHFVAEASRSGDVRSAKKGGFPAPAPHNLPHTPHPAPKTLRQHRANSLNRKIVGFTALGFEASEQMVAVQTAMLGHLPYTVLRDAILTHPTMSEGRIELLANVPGKRAREHRREVRQKRTQRVSPCANDYRRRPQ